MHNAQTFSQSSDQYAKHRPQYPAELFAYLSSLCQEHTAGWDCATGNGQAAISCAPYFDRVEATDVSAEQIQHSLAHPKVHYSVSPAEHTPFADHTFDLVTVATAIHWFDQPQFFREVDRILKPHGVLAAWTYGLFELDPEIDRVITKEFLEPIDPFWASGNRQVMNGYRDLTLPFAPIPHQPSFAMQLTWSLPQFAAYLRTWSAVKRYAAELGTDPVETLETKLQPLWENPAETKIVRMPLYLKVGSKPA